MFKEMMQDWHTLLLFVSHWPEHSLVAIPSGKGGWEVWHLDGQSFAELKFRGILLLKESR